VRPAAWIGDLSARRLAWRAAAVAGVGLGYYVLGFIGFSLRAPPAGFAIIWPPWAFLTGALLLTPPRDWWTYLLAVVVAHLQLVAQFIPAASLAVAATQIAGNAGIAAASALAIRRANQGRLSFDTFRDMLVFILVAGLAVPAVVSPGLIGIHLATGWAKDFWLSWRQWMLASIFPMITIPPLMALAARRRLTGGSDGPSPAEVLVLSAALFALAFLALGAAADSEYGPTLRLTPLPILLWAAIRWGVGGAGLSLLVFAGAVIVRALQGAGPFAAHSSTISVVSLQVYLTAISIPLMLLAALMQERKAARRQSDELAEHLLNMQDEERKAIAEALHASTAQHLVASGLLLDMLERRISATEEARGVIEDIRTSIAEAIHELRTFTYLLRPPELERQGLVDVLQRYVKGFGMRTGLNARIRLGIDADELPIQQQRALLRIAQESLANVHRHAAATRVAVNLRRHGGELHLVIRDDGRGLQTAGVRVDAGSAPLGVGIPGMAARVRQLGGKMDIRSGARGTTVHVALPMGGAAPPPRAAAETEPAI
jgi:signal transduction histidine kinase